MLLHPRDESSHRPCVRTESARHAAWVPVQVPQEALQPSVCEVECPEETKRNVRVLLLGIQTLIWVCIQSFGICTKPHESKRRGVAPRAKGVIDLFQPGSTCLVGIPLLATLGAPEMAEKSRMFVLMVGHAPPPGGGGGGA